MTKLQVAIYMDSERLSMLEAIMLDTKQKNISQALETVFKRLEMMEDQLRILRQQMKILQVTPDETPRDTSGLPPLADKYKIKKVKP